MWRHTPSLEFLILVTTVAPAELLRVMTSFGVRRADQVRLDRVSRHGVLVAYGVVTALAVLLTRLSHAPVSLPFAAPLAPIFAVIAIIAGALAFGLEFATGAIPAIAAGSRLRLRVNTAEISPDYYYLLSILLVAVAEECLYRGIWLGILRGPLHVAVAVAVPVAAAAYAAGHLFFGSVAVFQKLLSGIVFGTLMALSGSLVVPIIAHMSLNVVVFYAARSQRVFA